MGYIGMCGPKGYGFSAVLVINRLSIWPFWSLKIGYDFCTPVLNWVCCLEEATFSSLSMRSQTKPLKKLCLGQLRQPQRS